VKAEIDAALDTRALRACNWCKQWICADCGRVRSCANPRCPDMWCPTCKSRNGSYRVQLHGPTKWRSHEEEYQRELAEATIVT